jgi:hypothetical protein
VLILKIQEWEIYNEETNMFKTIPEHTLYLEHSLLSVSRWEFKYEKPFLDDQEQHTAEEMLDYIQFMSIGDAPYSRDDVLGLSVENVDEVKRYIHAKHSASNPRKLPRSPGKETITSELIYSWLVQQNIPFECERWNLSRLLMLINIVALENQPPEKNNPIENMKYHRELNAARHAAMKKPSIPTPHIHK